MGRGRSELREERYRECDKYFGRELVIALASIDIDPPHRRRRNAKLFYRRIRSRINLFQSGNSVSFVITAEGIIGGYLVSPDDWATQQPTVPAIRLAESTKNAGTFNLSLTAPTAKTIYPGGAIPGFDRGEFN